MITRDINGRKRPEGWVERRRRIRKTFDKTEHEAATEGAEARELHSNQEA